MKGWEPRPLAPSKNQDAVTGDAMPCVSTTIKVDIPDHRSRKIMRYQRPIDPRFAPMPLGNFADENPEMATAISENPVFAAIANEVEHAREVQAMRYTYIYGFSDEIVGQQTLPFILTIEQGTDFQCLAMTASCFSYDDQDDSDFPIPNSAGLTAWAGRGLSVAITDSNAGRDLTSGFIPMELIATPGYGLNFQRPYPFKYHFYRNNKIRFDVRNRDNANRTHAFAFALLGYKIVTPN